MKHLFQFNRMLLLLVAMFSLSISQTWAAEEVCKTSLFAAANNSKEIGSYTCEWYSTTEGFRLNVVNFNNNQNKWGGTIKAGSKKAKAADPAVESSASFVTNDPMESKITKILVYGSLANNSTISTKLIVADKSDMTTGADTISGPASFSDGVLTFVVSGKNLPAANKYYKLAFAVSNNTTTNGCLSVNKVEFYKEREPGSDTIVATPNFVINETPVKADNEYCGAQVVSLTCDTVGATIYYSTDSSSWNVYADPLNISQTTTYYAYAAKEGKANSACNKKTFTILQDIANDLESAYSVDSVKKLIDNGKCLQSEVYVKGVVSKIVKFDADNGFITYLLDNNAFMIYKGFGFGGAKFTSADDIQVGDTIVAKGKVKLYDKTYEMDQNNQLASLVRPQVLQSIFLGGDTIKEFTQGDAFSHDGMIVYAKYNTKDSVVVTDQAVWSGYDMSVVNVQTVTVSYTEEEVSKTATYQIQVKPGSCSSPANIAKGVEQGGTFTLSLSGDQCLDDGALTTKLVATAATHFTFTGVTSLKGETTVGTIGDIVEDTCVISNINDSTVITALFTEDPKDTAVFVKGAASATGDAPADIIEYVGDSIILPANTFANKGFKFVGWNDGDSVYMAGAKCLMVAGGKTFAAEWQETIKLIDVTFDEVEDSTLYYITATFNNKEYYLPATTFAATKSPSPVFDASAGDESQMWLFVKKDNSWLIKTQSGAGLYFTASNSGVACADKKGAEFSLAQGSAPGFTYISASDGTDIRYLAEYNAKDWRCYTSTSVSNGTADIKLYRVRKPGEVARPTIAPSTAEFLDSVDVTITGDDNCEFYYTLDGTEPTSASTKYTAAFRLYATTTVKAIAVSVTSSTSKVAEFTYKRIPEYASLEALVAAGAPTAVGNLVKVTIAPTRIDSVVKNGLYVTAGGQVVEIYGYDMSKDWVAGGTIAGTTVAKWFMFKTTWELSHSNWADFTYTAPVAEPELVVNPTDVNFGEVALNEVVAAQEVNVTLVNLTSATAAISGSAFTIDQTSLSASGKITITPSTAVAGEYSETLTISSAGVQSVNVTVTMVVKAPSALDNVKAASKVAKMVIDNRIVIIRDGKRFSALGQEL